MDCEIRDRLFWAYAMAVDDWQQAFDALPDPPVESWAKHREEIARCTRMHERANQARAELETHRKEHGC